MSNKRRKLKKGILSLFMTAIMALTAVGFLNVSTAEAISYTPFDFQLIVQPAPNNNLPQNFNVDWQLVKASDKTAVNPSDVGGSPTNGTFNQDDFASSTTQTINFVHVDNVNEYQLKLTGQFAGATVRDGVADITSELEGSGRFVNLSNQVLTLQVELPNNNPGQNPGPGQNSGQNPGPAQNYSNSAKIHLTAPAGSWTVSPMVDEDYDAKNQDGTASAPYNRYAFTTSVSINGGQNTDKMNQYKKDENISRFQDQTIGYNRDGAAGTVSITFRNNWANMFEGNININGTDYDVSQFIDYSNRNQWLNDVVRQDVEFTIDNVPVSTTLDGSAEVYNIEVKVRPIEESECLIGNFLWSNDPMMDPETTGMPDDRYIGHSRLTLLSVTYDDGTGEQTKSIEEMQTMGAPYLQYKEDVDNSTGANMSEMFLPEGSWVTMKIEPEYGYQVKSFSVNGNDVRTSDESVFSFKIGKGNFHIGAHVEKVEDEARVNAADVSISGADVELAAGTLDRGSARLYVDDTQLTPTKTTEFESYATSTGTKIDSYVDIHMDQVFYKGTGNDDDVWANPMNDLNDAATIKLKLDDYSGEDIVLLHNEHDGDNFEEIPLTYNAADGTYEGKVTSFSNFAIAKKTSAAATVTSAPAQKVTVAKSPKTDDITNIIYWIMMGIGAVIVVFGINIYAQKMKK
ncbi:MAG: hypothetical protein K6E43_09025 [Lachnospiraceae bacterium]|nr:hypothetical protein [Lachnospiraceae bacterium]